jgi:hypothetical protein
MDGEVASRRRSGRREVLRQTVRGKRSGVQISHENPQFVGETSEQWDVTREAAGKMFW